MLIRHGLHKGRVAAIIRGVYVDVGDGTWRAQWQPASVDEAFASLREALVRFASLAAAHPLLIVLEDLHSTNGTWVNTQQVMRHALTHGDVILIGKHHLVFDRHASADPQLPIQGLGDTVYLDTNEHRALRATLEDARVQAERMAQERAVTKVGDWPAVLLIGLAASAHQAWSANLYTTVSDMFPKKDVATITGLGGMTGSAGGFLFPILTGALLDHFKAAGNITADPTDATHLAVVWSDMRNSTTPAPGNPYAAATNSDVVVSQSFDRGRTWSAPVALTLSGDQFMPWGTYDSSGLLRIGVFDRQYDAANRLYGYSLATESSAHSLTFTTAELTTARSDPTTGDRWFAASPNRDFPFATTFLGDYSNIAALPGGGVVAYWTDMRQKACFAVRLVT